MEKEFAPYAEALALKQLGFDDECLGTYYEEDKTFYLNGVLYSNSYFTKAQELFPEHPQITTPLYQQCWRWFKEKYNIHGIISYYGKGQWFLEILDYKGNQLIQIENNTFWSYEEAELECLKKLIEIVKTK
jgi:hypothetical protein